MTAVPEKLLREEPIVTPGAWGPEKLARWAVIHGDDCACFIGRRVRAARRWGAPV